MQLIFIFFVYSTFCTIQLDINKQSKQITLSISKVLKGTTLQVLLQISHPLFYLFYAKFTMLERPGDLIPVLPNATSIPWTRRRSQILNFLHRGPVTFGTLVYDTNVGDISALATYFNPDRISERELNLRFGHYPTSGEKHASGSPQNTGTDPVVKPRLLLYPDHNLNSSQVRTNLLLSIYLYLVTGRLQTVVFCSLASIRNKD